MQVIIVKQFGGPEQMVLTDVAMPWPGPGQVLVRHAYCGINFADVSQREGRTQGSGTQYETQLPYTPGNEASGIVEQIGRDVREFALGDRVAYRGVFGAYAEVAVVPVEQLLSVPAELSLQIAGACLTHGMTAHYVTHDAHRVQAGEWILVHAAAGGTGSLVVQMAKLRGATVVATASTEAKLARARASGADHVINYGQQDFAQACREISGFTGFHAVLDNVSATTFERNLRLLRPGGDLVIFGMSSGPIPPFDLQRLNALGSLSIRRTNMKHYVLDRVALVRRAGAVFEMLRRQQITIHIGGVYPLAEVARAHDTLKQRRSVGKLLLRP